MKKFITLFIIISLLISLKSNSQEKYWVFFKNKKETTFNPFEYFDAKAIERRIKYNIPLYDSTDFPLNNDYINQVSKLCSGVTSQTRWFNGIAVWATKEQIENIKSLHYVKSIVPITYQSYPCGQMYDTVLNENDKFLLLKQIETMQGNLFIDSGFTGKGIRIAVFDGGFPTVNTSPVFEHIRKENRIIKTYDFAHKKENVYGYMSHGTYVLSCIAGIINDKRIGLATDAEFLLAKTEIVKEPFSEEENWLAAVEWADKNGADIISSSLGYTDKRYFYEDMDGHTTLVTKAGNMAAAKGILVINSAGNEGTDDWKHIGAPADADSVLSVGGIDPYTEYHIDFSSYGPTYDKRLKPNVSACAFVLAAGKNKLVTVQGTSFSCPLVSGFAACAWQTNPSLSNMELFKEIEKSASLYPYFDYAHGYGIPQASYFFNKDTSSVKETFFIEKQNGVLNIKTKPEFIDPNSKKYLYYNIKNEKGFIEYYAVIQVYQENIKSIYINNDLKNKTLTIHYRGYTKEISLN
ncbi:MAG: S8 family serine peptidase [Marinilabiliales bacterium]